MSLAPLNLLEHCVHGALLLACVSDTFESIRTDEWAVIRSGKPAHEGRRAEILSKRRHAARMGKLLGGYTPRIVALAGLMLRSVQMATKLRYIFDPSLGFAAGAALAASFAQREWLKCMLLGWGAGGLYWGGFRVRPPAAAGTGGRS